jgi:membrane associated rhomboid family serine protease
MHSELHDRLRRIWEYCAVPGLIRYVVLFNALVFILHLLAPGYLSVLELNPALVLRGEIWRLITWIFIPETLSPFWIFFSLLFLLYLGDGLEAAMGAARLTSFYLCGILLCTVVSFAFGLSAGGTSIGRANTFLNLSLLLAYATVYPDFKVLVFFILPVRIAWLALFSAFIMILSALGQPLIVAATLGAAFLNYLLFFSTELRSHLGILKRGVAGFSGAPTRLKPQGQTQGKTQGKTNHPVETLHRCEACGNTESSHPDIDFRVTADGREFCREHLPSKA